MTTQERFETESWWPTMPSVSLEAFAGSNTCARCHAEEASHKPATSMQRAAELGKVATFLKAKRSTNFASPPFTYSLVADAEGIEYSASDGEHRIAHKLDWVMGAGELGRTFLYEQDGHWYQSEATFYTEPDRLDITTGLSRPRGATLAEALGEVLSAEDASRCFSCHTVHSTTTHGFSPLHAEAGLGCEACHGPARAHVERMNAADKNVVGAHGTNSELGVFNPAKLSPVDANDFCGACHRAYSDAMLSTGGMVTTAVVRFQPYRLEESKCWRKTQDARLTCVECHDPHQPLNRDTGSYDRYCLSCHTGGAKGVEPEHAGAVCPKAKSQCVTCHMPKVAIASMHGSFTDHFIRVVKADEGFPR